MSLLVVRKLNVSPLINLWVLLSNIDHLNWNEHCDGVCNKVRKNCFYRESSKMYYLALLVCNSSTLVLPHFDYCSNVWYSGHASQLNSLNILQKRAMRLILNVPYDTPSSVLFKSMNWMSIEFRCHYNISLLVYKCLHNLTPSYLNFFSVNNNITRAASRSDLKIPFAKKDILKNSFRVQGAKIFNSLPCAIRVQKSVVYRLRPLGVSLCSCRSEPNYNVC